MAVDIKDSTCSVESDSETGYESSQLSILHLSSLLFDAEAPILWPPDVKSQLIGKDSDAVKD